MLSNVDNNFNFLPQDIHNYLFSYLSPSDLGNVASTSKGMYALSHSQRLKKAQETLKEASKFQGIIRLPSFDTKSEDLNYFNTSICFIQQKIKSIPMFREIFVTNHGDFRQIAQEIQDRDLVIVLKQIAPPEMQQQMEGLPNSQAAAIARNWLKDLDPQDDFFQIVSLQLSNLQLTSIPPEIFTYFPNLQTLNLSRNQIQVIPPQIGQLLNLQELELSNNKIQVVPSKIGKLLNLQVLDLSHNPIQTLPVEINHLKNLYLFFISKPEEQCCCILL